MGIESSGRVHAEHEMKHVSGYNTGGLKVIMEELSKSHSREYANGFPYRK